MKSVINWKLIEDNPLPKESLIFVLYKPTKDPSDKSHTFTIGYYDEKESKDSFKDVLADWGNPISEIYAWDYVYNAYEKFDNIEGQ